MERRTFAGRWALISLPLFVSVTAVHSAAEQPTDRPSPQPKLTDAEVRQHDAELGRLWKEFNQLEARGKTNEAIAVEERMLAINRQLFGNVHAVTAWALEELAQRYLRLDDFDRATKARQESLAIQTKLHGANDWRTTDARLALDDLQLRRRLTAPERRELLEISAINSEIVSFYRKGNIRQAIPLAKRAVEIRQRLLGNRNRDVATSLDNLAALYRAAGDDAAAEPILRRAVEINQAVLGELHPDFASDLNTLANFYVSRREYAKAEPLYRRVIQIRKQVLGEASQVYGNSLTRLAEIYQIEGDDAKALPLCIKAAEISKKALGESHPEYAASLRNLASLYQRQRDYVRAAPLYRRVAEIWKKAFGETGARYALSLNDLANLYRLEGDFFQAEPLYLKSLQIRRKIFGENHPACARSLHDLATLYWSEGDDARAEPLYRQALAINKQTLGDDSAEYAANLNNLGELYETRGDFSRAEPLLRQSLEIRRKTQGETSAEYLSSLTNLAGLYDDRRDFLRAEPLYLRAIEIQKKTLGRSHPDYARTVANLAALYQATGDCARAEPLSREALAVFEQHFLDNLVLQSERQQLASAKLLRGNLDQYLRITANLRTDVSQTYRHVLRWKGAVFARQRVSGALRKRPELKAQFDALKSVNVRLSQLVLTDTVGLQQESFQRNVEELIAQKEAIESAISGRLADSREASRLSPPTPEELRGILPNKAALVDFLEYADSQTGTAGIGRSEPEIHLCAFILRYDAPPIRIELGPVTPLYDAMARWRRAIGRGSGGLAEPSNGPMTPPQRFLREKVWEPLQKRLAGIDRVLASTDGFLNQVPLAALPGSERDKYLVEEIAIVMIPAPRLLPVLLGMKPVTNDARHESLLLVGNCDFGRASDAADVNEPGARAQHTTRSGEWQRASGALYPPLPGTAKEIERIGRIYSSFFIGKSPDVLAGQSATTEAFRREAEKHRFIHVASHGFFADNSTLPDSDKRRQGSQNVSENPALATRRRLEEWYPGLQSGIALANANGSRGPATLGTPQNRPNADAGILTALETASLDLSNVDLVVLSACETGVGRFATSSMEGPLGLQRALLMAGSKSTVTSLWRVDDGATQALMTEFYTNLWEKKLGKLEALRQAQITMIHRYDPREKKLATRGLDVPETPRGFETGAPYFWAGFVLSGDWR